VDLIYPGVDRIIGEYVPTARNGMVADFFPRLGFEPAADSKDSKIYVCKPDRFRALKSFIAVKDLTARPVCSSRNDGRRPENSIAGL